MIEQQVQAPPTKSRSHWPSILVLLNAVAGLLFFIGVAGISFLNGIIGLVSPEAGPNDVARMFSYTAAGVLLSVLLLPSIVLAFKRISGDRASMGRVWEKAFSLLHPKKLIWLFPLIVLAGSWVNNQPPLNWLLMPVLNVLSLSIPVAWLVWLGSRGLNLGSSQRNWSTFGIGITASPLVIMVIEIAIMVMAFFTLAILFSTIFAGVDLNLDSFLSSLTQGSDFQQINEQDIAQFIRQPFVLGLILMFVSGVVPLIEEVLKPMATWLLWRRPLTPQDGWILGLLGGASFALIENMGNLMVGDGWEFLVLARAGAAALHIFNTAIISYTITLARVKKRILPAVLGLTGAILIHAFWNGITIFATLTSLENSIGSDEIWPTRYIIPLVVIALGLVGAIAIMNQRFRTKNRQAASADTASQPTPLEAALPETNESEQ